jgi:FkbM family methyltransferase
MIREIRATARHWLSWRGRRLDHVLPSGLGIRVSNRSEWNVYNEIMVDGEYDVPIRMIIDAAPVEPWILDLGAHAGFFTLRFADLWNRSGAGRPFHVACVEGAAQTVRHLAAHLAQPPLFAHCTVHHGLVGARCGRGRISRSIRSSINSIVEPASLRSTEVPFLDLDTLVPPDVRISLLKCDVEGAEELFLATYDDLLRRVDLAVFELHGRLCDVSRCRSLLEAAGLTTRTLLRVFPETTTVEMFERPRRRGIESAL